MICAPRPEKSEALFPSPLSDAVMDPVRVRVVPLPVAMTESKAFAIGCDIEVELGNLVVLIGQQ